MGYNYKCVECGLEFDKPRRFVDRHGLDSPPYEEFNGCPKCGGNYLTEEEYEKEYGENEDECDGD